MVASESRSMSVLSHPDGVAVIQRFGDPRLIGPAAVALGFAATLVVATIESSTDLSSHLSLALVMMAAAVATASWWAGPATAALIALLGWMSFNGFVVNQAGSLRWHGVPDAERLAVVIIAGLASAGIRAAQVKMRRQVRIEDIAELSERSRSAQHR
jgi:K+-sensing histidine kinase KdpD